VSLAAFAFKIAFAALQAPSGQSGPLTLDEALRIAEQNAFAIKLQEAIVEQNRQRVAEARGNMGPRVTLSGTYTRWSEQGTSNFGGQTVVTQPIDNKSVNVIATMPIDIAGNLRRQVNAARENEQASRDLLRASVNDVRLSTKQAYFAVLRAEGLVRVAEQSVRSREEWLSQARKLYEQQQIARVDVTRYENDLSQAQADLINARNQLQLAQQQFNLVLARPIETPVELATVGELPAVSTGTDDLVTLAQAQRPEVLALGNTLEALANVRRAQEAGMNPSLSVSLQHQRTIDAQGFSARNEQTYGTLNLGIPLFDSGVTRARVRAARQDEERARINLSQTKLVISQEVRTALANMGSARARLDNAERQVLLAAEVLRLARVKQEAGTGTYVEIVDAETALTNARNALVAARYDYLTSYAQLQRAVGNDALTALAPGATK
jgi:outer membrane protein TolC